MKKLILLFALAISASAQNDALDRNAGYIGASMPGLNSSNGNSSDDGGNFRLVSNSTGLVFTVTSSLPLKATAPLCLVNGNPQATGSFNGTTLTLSSPLSANTTCYFAINYAPATLSTATMSLASGIRPPVADCTVAASVLYVQTGAMPQSWVCGSDHTYWQRVGSRLVSYVVPPATMSALNRWHDWQFKQQIGGIAYADARTAAASDNLLAFGTSHFDWANAWSDTNGLASNSPADDKRLRFTGGSGSHIAGRSMTLTGGQPYTLTLNASSNVNATNQTARLYFNQGGSYSIGPDKGYAPNGSTWAYTLTPPTTATYSVGIVNDAAGDNADIEVACLKLEAGATSTGCAGVADQAWNAYLGEAALPGAYGQPSWNSPAGLNFPGGSGLYYGYATGTPQSFSAISVYMAFQLSGTPQNNTYIPLLSSDFANRALYLACNDADMGGAGFQFAGTIAAATNVNCNDGLAHIVTATYDGAIVAFYLDGTLIATQAQTGLTVSNLKELLLGNVNLYASFPGKIYGTRIYTVADTASQVAANVPLYRAELAANGITIPAMKVKLNCDGDSIEKGQGASTPQNSECYLLRQQSTTFLQGANSAVAGATLHDLGDHKSLENRVALDDSLKLAGGKNILYTPIGTNDMGYNVGDVRVSTSTMDAYITSYISLLTTHAGAGGYDWSMGSTIMPICYNDGTLDPKAEANREYFNSHLLSQASGVAKLTIADIAGAPAFSYNGTGTNPACQTTYFVDGKHPNDNGHAARAAVTRPIVGTILSTLNP